MRKVNDTTYEANHKDVDVVIGDEKQTKFFPRVKLKKWNNEVNFSAGVISKGEGSVRHDKNSLVYEEHGITSKFYELTEQAPPAATQIRWIKEGYITPERIAAEYEVDRHFDWGPTIRSHFTDRKAMMYYGYYPASHFIDGNKIDIPEVRLSATNWNDPMIMDKGLPLIDIHYNPKRDNTLKIHEYTVQAITEVLKKHGIDVQVSDNPYKLYFKDGDKLVKFYSGFWIGGHFYYYINLDCDYNSALEYYKVPTEPRNDTYAYGLRTIQKDLPDSIVDEVVTRFAQLYGTTFKPSGSIPLVQSDFTDKENAKIAEIEKAHTAHWVQNAVRDDVYALIAGEDNHDGFEFDITLPTKPRSNIYPLSITTKGLKFYKQEPVAPTLKDNYMVRPPRVDNSYAVYHQSKKNNEYQTGKAFHIYRPFVTDAKGWRVWADIQIDETKSVVNIILPQDFLDKATYPITIDPAFGYTAAGASSAILSNNGGSYTIRALVSTGTVGTLTSITSYVDTLSGGTLLFKYALYQASDGSKVAETSEQNDASPVAVSWRTLNTTTTPSLTAVSYWIAAWGSTTSGAYNTVDIYYDTITNAGLNKAVTYGAWPSPLTGATTDSNNYSIYANYTATTSAASNFFMLMH